MFAPMAQKKRKNKVNGVPMARLADKYTLYLDSVQSPDHEAQFFNRAYKKAFDRAPLILREDFCGTAAVCCEWVKNKPERRALGVDLDAEPLAWGRENNLTSLRERDRERITLLEADVRDIRGPKADVVAAQNFSFYCFKTREELRRYFRCAYRNMAREGVLVLDMLGGQETMEEDHEEIKKMKGYDYVFEQEWFDPITNNCRFWIHFRFPDGSEMKRVFGYEWRLWSIPEVRELLSEAGFAESLVYWEDTEKDTGEGSGTYRIRKKAESDPTWVAYIVARKQP